MKTPVMSWFNVALRHAGRSVADFLLPPLCLGCKTPVKNHNVVCARCWSEINFITAPVCERLGTPLPFYTGGTDAGEAMISAAALAHPPVYDRARSVAHFQGPVRDMIHALKYADHHEGRALFGRLMSHAGQDILKDADYLVPVPLYRWRLWFRRFNQSAVLAGAVAKETGLPVHPFILERIRSTKTQIGLTLKQRRKNVSGAFRVPDALKPHVAYKKIVLIDDVLTTGSTVEACAKVLKKEKAERVDVLTLGRVVDVMSLEF